MKAGEVQKIARLARLAINSEEVESTAQTLSEILSLIEQLNAAQLSDTDPLAHPLEITQRLREDQVRESDRRKALQSGAPQVADGLYLVPKVIE